jgi:hypothetical protein
MSGNPFVDGLGLVTAAIFVGLSMLHVFWALGRRQPSGAVIPTQAGRPLFTPTPTTTLLVALALLICAVLVLGTLGLGRFGLPAWLFRFGTFGVGAAFLLRAIGEFHYVGFFKTVRDTAFARNDSRLYSPLCLAIAVCCAAIGAWG